MDTQTTTDPKTSADRTGAVKQETATAASEVASTAAEEAKRVTSDATHQVRHLMGQTRSDLQQQAAAQQSRAASGLRELADQLREMADSSESDGMARGLVDDVARRAGEAASWLDSRDPGSVLDEARGFARRRPGTFLALAAGVGVLAGRFSRSLIDEARDESDHDATMSTGGRSTGSQATPGSYGTDPVPQGAPLTSGAVAGGGTAGTAGGIGDTDEVGAVDGIPPSDTGRSSSGSAATTSGVPSAAPTSGGSPMASQSGAAHPGTDGFTTEEDSSALRGER